MNNKTENLMQNKNQNKVDEKTVEKIANLSRLEISAEQRFVYAQNLSSALTYFEQIADIPTEGVEPLVTPTEIEFVFREDEVSNEVSTEDLMANTSSKLGHLFKVPPVV